MNFKELPPAVKEVLPPATPLPKEPTAHYSRGRLRVLLKDLVNRGIVQI